jgi:hypothetical protein
MKILLMLFILTVPTNHNIERSITVSRNELIAVIMPKYSNIWCNQEIVENYTIQNKYKIVFRIKQSTVLRVYKYIEKPKVHYIIHTIKINVRD